MISNEEYLRLKSLLLTKRSKIAGMGSDWHWLKMPKEIRRNYSEAFKQLSCEQIAEITGFLAKDIQKWKEQELIICELKKRVEICKKEGGKYFSNTTTIRPDVCGVAKLSSNSAVGEELGIPEGTIRNWLKNGWDKVEISDVKEAVAESASENIDTDDIGTNPETRQLELFLERHRGKLRKKYSLAEKKLILNIVDRFGSKAVHEHFKVSYDTIARLKRMVETELERKSRVPMRYIPVVELMRQHPGMGPMQIRDYIHRHLGLTMGVNSIRKVMEQNGWVPPYVKTTRLTEGLQLYEAARKNYLWHMDFKHQYVNKCKVYLLFIQDDYSRFIVGHALSDGEKIDVVLSAIEESIRIHGRSESIMTDGGSAFFSWRGCSKFTRFLEDFGIEQLIAQTPNINGKLENLNQQVEKELIMVTNFASVDHFQKELSKWVGFYNFSRVHQGLGHNQVPADRYFPGAKQWYGETCEQVRQQSLIAETMSTLLTELKRPK